jgi:hypothetical protein
MELLCCIQMVESDRGMGDRIQAELTRRFQPEYRWREFLC